MSKHKFLFVALLALGALIESKALAAGCNDSFYIDFPRDERVRPSCSRWANQCPVNCPVLPGSVRSGFVGWWCKCSPGNRTFYYSRGVNGSTHIYRCQADFHEESCAAEILHLAVTETVVHNTVGRIPYVGHAIGAASALFGIVNTLDVCLNGGTYRVRPCELYRTIPSSIGPRGALSSNSEDQLAKEPTPHSGSGAGRTEFTSVIDEGHF